MAKSIGQTGVKEHNTQHSGSAPGARKSGLKGDTKTKGINRTPKGKK